jgi:glycine hydroxymethyltransferase
MLHIVAAKAACFGEALRPEFRIYNEAALANAKALADMLAEGGVRLVGGGTDTSMVLADLVNQGIDGDVAAKALEKAGLAANKNLIPFDTRTAEAPSGLRLSSNAGTTRGFGVEAFRQIGDWIARIVNAPDDATQLAQIHEAVRALCARFPIYPDLR